METKSFKGKAIYNPSGKAGEYSYWACNLYKGCSNGCEYCYLKKGILAKALGGDTPTLKKCFDNEAHALEVFKKELLQNLPELQKHGLFFSFTTDPMLPETNELTLTATSFAIDNNVPAKILTKSICEQWMMRLIEPYTSEGCQSWRPQDREKVAIGFTLTGFDELERGASTNAERIEAMKKLHDAGFRTFASIEPIIDFESSLSMIEQTLGHCDLYKIGLMSGGKKPNKDDLFSFIGRVTALAKEHKAKVYWKDSVRKNFDFIDYEESPGVGRDYNMFNQ